MSCLLLAKMDQVFCLKKVLEKWKKYWKSQGIFSILKSGNHVYLKDSLSENRGKKIEYFFLKVTPKWLMNGTSCSNQAARLVSIRSCVNIDWYSATWWCGVLAVLAVTAISGTRRARMSPGHRAHLSGRGSSFYEVSQSTLGHRDGSTSLH